MTTAPAAPHDSAFLRACRREPVPHTPVWFMRQAGRALPEYRALRAGNQMLDACATPDLVTEITLQPVRRYGVDAAIFFSDIVVPLKAVGVDLDIVPGTGPVVRSRSARPPTSTGCRAHARRRPVHHRVGPLARRRARRHAAHRLRRRAVHAGELPRRGRPSKNHAATKALMYGRARPVVALLDRLATITLASCGCRSTPG
jgi:uroporphyrinogen decarboxylase